MSIYGKGTDPKLALLVQLWPIFSSWRGPKSIKITSSAEKLKPLSHPNMSKWSLHLNIYIHKYIHIHIRTYIHNTRLVFAIFGMCLPGNRVGSQVRGVKSKFDKYYFIHTINGHLPVQKIWFKYFPVFAAINHKGHFRKVLTGIFKFGWFSWYNSYIFKKVKLNYLIQNWWFNWHQFQIPPKKTKKLVCTFIIALFRFETNLIE